MTLEQFRADVQALVARLDATARGGYLPGYLPPGADVTRMARTVRVLGEVRRGAAADGPGGDRPPDGDGLERDQLYVLPAERGARAGPPRPWEQLAEESQQLVVLADAGMGKSWLIRAETHRLAAAAAGLLAGGSAGVEDVLIPVPVRADVLATGPGRDLAEVAAGYLAAEGLLPGRSAARLRERVAAGGVVLLVDALDEVPRGAPAAGGQAPGKRLQDLLRQWAAGCPGTARCVLTSRLAGYAGPPLPGAREAELLPFTPQDTRAAVHAWELPAAAAGRVDRLLADPGMAGLARVPLLLALICSLAADPEYHDALPVTRAGLYEAVLWHFLSGSHRADRGSPAAALAPDEREGLLRDLGRAAFAFATTGQGWVDRMPHSALATAIGGTSTGIAEPGPAPAEELIRRCEQAGVLVPAGNPSLGGQAYMFLHRTIAEYLTARHLRDLPPAARMRAVADHQWFDPDWAEVMPMLGGLLAAPDPAGAQALVAHFLSQWPDPLHRALYTALRILGEHPDPGRLLDPSQADHFIQRAISLLTQDVTQARVLAVLTTTAAWPRSLLEALLPLLRDPDRFVRFAAAGALAGHPDPAAAQALLPLLRDPDRGVLSAAADALAGHPDPAAAQALLPLLRDPDRGVLSAAADALAGQPDPAVAQALLPLLRDPDRFVRFAAAGALAGHPDPAAAQALLLLLRNDPDRGVRFAAARALAGHPDPAVAQALLPLLRDPDSFMRSAAAGALAGHPDPAVAQALLPLLRDPDRFVRSAAAGALAGHPDPAATQALLPLLRDPDRFVRSAAAGALAGHPDPAATQALLPLLRDPDRFVRSAAAGALAGHPDPAATQALLPLLRDPDRGVRFAAAGALAGHPDPAATQALIPLLRDPIAFVRDAAADALAGRSEPWLLTQVTRQGILPKRASRRAVLYRLADQIADRDYLRLPSGDRPRIRRRLGKLTRKAAPIPRQRRLTAASRLHALARQAKTQLRQRPLPAAATVAVAAIVGVVGGKLTGKVTLGLAAAFAGLLVAGMILTYLAERGADTPGTQDADRHPR